MKSIWPKLETNAKNYFALPNDCINLKVFNWTMRIGWEKFEHFENLSKKKSRWYVLFLILYEYLGLNLYIIFAT